jgi:hypothetical protein
MCPRPGPLVEEKRALKRRLAHIDAGLARLTPEQLAALTPARRETLDHVLAVRRELSARVAEVGKALAELARMLMETVDAARINRARHGPSGGGHQDGGAPGPAWRSPCRACPSHLEPPDQGIKVLR